MNISMPENIEEQVKTVTNHTYKEMINKLILNGLISCSEYTNVICNMFKMVMTSFEVIKLDKIINDCLDGCNGYFHKRNQELKEGKYNLSDNLIPHVIHFSNSSFDIKNRGKLLIEISKDTFNNISDIFDFEQDHQLAYIVLTILHLHFELYNNITNEMLLLQMHNYFHFCFSNVRSDLRKIFNKK